MSSRPFFLLPLCFVSALALNAYAALDPTGVYQDYLEKLDAATPPVAAMATAAADGVYPWSEPKAPEPPPVPDPAPLPDPEPEPEPEPEETEEQRRARLIKKMEDIFAAAEPMENYTFTLNDPVTVEGREYYYGVWQRVITDYDTQSRYLSTVAEFFITPDGDECYIGNHFPANEGNGETVVFSSGNIFEEINNG